MKYALRYPLSIPFIVLQRAPHAALAKRRGRAGTATQPLPARQGLNGQPLAPCAMSLPAPAAPQASPLNPLTAISRCNPHARYSVITCARHNPQAAARAARSTCSRPAGSAHCALTPSRPAAAHLTAYTPGGAPPRRPPPPPYTTPSPGSGGCSTQRPPSRSAGRRSAAAPPPPGPTG